MIIGRELRGEAWSTGTARGTARSANALSSGSHRLPARLIWLATTTFPFSGNGCLMLTEFDRAGRRMEKNGPADRKAEAIEMALEPTTREADFIDDYEPEGAAA